MFLFPFDLNKAKMSAESLGSVRDHIPFYLTVFCSLYSLQLFHFRVILYHHLGISISVIPSCLQDSLLKEG